MIVNFNQNISTHKKQRTAFGDAYSANKIKGTVLTSLNTKAADLKITPQQAIDRLQNAINGEDKAGRSILKKAIREISAKLSGKTS